MEKLSKEQQEVIAQLYSSSDSKVLKAIDDLRELGNENTLPPLLNLLKTTESETVREEIFRYLNELKSQKGLHYIIEAIEDESFAIFKGELIQSLWESGAECKPYLTQMVRIAQEEDFMVALEAVTVIEAMNPPFDPTLLNQLADQTEASMALEDGIKSDLLKSLVTLLRNMAANPSADDAAH